MIKLFVALHRCRGGKFNKNNFSHANYSMISSLPLMLTHFFKLTIVFSKAFKNPDDKTWSIKFNVHLHNFFGTVLLSLPTETLILQIILFLVYLKLHNYLYTK